MNVQDAMRQLTGTLVKMGQDRYYFACGRAVLLVRLVGARTLVRFVARDRVAFRIDAVNLTIEDLRTCAIRRKFVWDKIECVAAGEPESDNSDLFQG
jgi:hypothetical protein